MMMERVLVVDEDREYVERLGAYLQRVGYRVFTACDSQDALRILCQERPHLIMMRRVAFRCRLEDGEPEDSLIAVAAYELGMTVKELVVELERGDTVAGVASD
jgi:ActR/RegA family two-component response regulator